MSMSSSNLPSQPPPPQTPSTAYVSCFGEFFGTEGDAHVIRRVEVVICKPQEKLIIGYAAWEGEWTFVETKDFICDYVAHFGRCELQFHPTLLPLGEAASDHCETCGALSAHTPWEKDRTGETKRCGSPTGWGGLIQPSLNRKQ
jgi:hypothetical protein